MEIENVPPEGAASACGSQCWRRRRGERTRGGVAAGHAVLRKLSLTHNHTKLHYSMASESKSIYFFPRLLSLLRGSCNIQVASFFNVKSECYFIYSWLISQRICLQYGIYDLAMGRIRCDYVRNQTVEPISLGLSRNLESHSWFILSLIFKCIGLCF